MGREFSILWIGRRRPEWEELCSRYRTRIERSVPVVDRVLRSPTGQDDRRVELEADSLRAALPERAWTVALDRRGRQRTSPEIARWLTRRLEEWPHPVVFLIGSDLGIAPELTSDCRERWSLGPLTLPHELARLVLYEQLYRGLSIAAGIKYHRGPL